MAEKRMFAKQIVLSDDFLDMPCSTRCLYFTLGMLADDDGFINSYRSVMRQIGASEDDLKLLLAKSFLIRFDNGVMVIKHWRINNYIRSDRYKPTTYTEEMNCLSIKENGAYSFGIPGGIPRVEENRLDKISIEESKPPRHKYGEYKNVLLSDEDIEKLKDEIPNYESYIEALSSYMKSKGTSYKDHLATIRNWHRKDLAKTKEKKPKMEQRDINYDNLESVLINSNRNV